VLFDQPARVADAQVAQDHLVRHGAILAERRGPGKPGLDRADPRR
jgi:hypothetical protein